MAQNETEISVGMGERIRAGLRGMSPSTGRKVDRYLSTNLPDLIEQHSIALKSGLSDVDTALGNYEDRVDELEGWRETTKGRIGDARHRLELFEKKYSLDKE